MLPQSSDRIPALRGLLAFGLLAACAGQPAERGANTAPKANPTLESAASAHAKKSERSKRENRHESASAEDPIVLRYPRSPTPWLGVELRATEGARAGVEITRVLAGSPAAKAQLRAGDVLLTLDDTPADSPVDVANWVRSQQSEETFPLTILRKGSPRLIRAKLEGMPQFEDRLRLALVNRQAPEIAGVATFQGDASSLRELRGQVVVLEFWASYCGVCRFLAPRLDAWHRAYNPQGAEVVGITVDTPEIGRRVAARTGMSYTLASDPDSRISRAYLASQIPAVVVIDRKGVVRDAMVGYSEGRLRETEQLIEKLLDD